MTDEQHNKWNDDYEARRRATQEEFYRQFEDYLQAHGGAAGSSCAAPAPAPASAPQSAPAPAATPAPQPASAVAPAPVPVQPAPVAAPQSVPAAPAVAPATPAEQVATPIASYAQPATPSYAQPTTPSYAQPAASYSSANAGCYAAPTPQQGVQSAPSVPNAPAHTPKAAKKKCGTFLKNMAAGFCGALIACGLVWGAYALFGNNGKDDASENTNSGGTTVIGSSGNSITVVGEDVTLAEVVAAKCTPSVGVVKIYTYQSSYDGWGWMFNERGNSSKTLTYSGLGSGVVISTDGYVLTNEHVISEADKITFALGSKEYDAEVVGSDSTSDIAVLKLTDASGLTAMEIGDSDELVLGQWVMTIGSPMGVGISVATGIVSATSRSETLTDSSTGTTRYYANLIQTDAVINPGNSGGALINADGELVGINSMYSSSTESYAGVGFAIPSNYAISIARDIIDGKTPSHAALGVSITSVSSYNKSRLGVDVDSGAYVSEVYSGSGAEKAGIKAGDVIVKVNDTEVTSGTELILAVRGYSIGTTVKVTVNRGGEELTMQVTLMSDADL